ncbi:UrcA family protein [Novosphingobium olei]|uniref:UrcA family protein n=1 Tax=Novosphingobium olei TaxID=2728851 RepID=A0A7Y0BMC5_9SPHN|nr:UrcA family protein [Novosphingobium olei]NML93032.1 UrcA family protein [Novosphingobium olei]BEU99599.1 UrcA family protein [Novosphingobium olei]
MKKAFVAIAMFACATQASAATQTTTANPFAKDAAILDLKGLDLATADGQQRLAIRLDAAARAVCGERLEGVHLALEAKAQACRAAVTADVRNQIEARMAAAEKTGTRVASLR